MAKEKIEAKADRTSFGWYGNKVELTDLTEQLIDLYTVPAKVLSINTATGKRREATAEEVASERLRCSCYALMFHIVMKNACVQIANNNKKAAFEAYESSNFCFNELLECCRQYQWFSEPIEKTIEELAWAEESIDDTDAETFNEYKQKVKTELFELLDADPNFSKAAETILPIVYFALGNYDLS